MMEKRVETGVRLSGELPAHIAEARRWEQTLAVATSRHEAVQLAAEDGREHELRAAWRGVQATGIDPELLALAQAERDRLAVELRDRLDALLLRRRSAFSLADLPLLDLNLPSDDDDPRAEMWWGSTVWSRSDPGLVLFWDDAGVGFAGTVDRTTDRYYRCGFTLVASYHLTLDRVPRELFGQVRSAPQALLLGEARGSAVRELFDLGDQWCKCWLNLRQTAFIRPPAVPFVPVATAASSIELIYIDGSAIDHTFLPGSVAMPPVTFPVAPGFEVQIDLEVSVDIQMCGDHSTLIFGAGQQFDTNLIRLDQWFLTKA